MHIDCDAFYATVEELERPELKTVPMAVGKGVLTTCNYEARKYGCRSGMAGFVAMKLCPQLICLPMNFAKYSAKANEVRTVLAEYDMRFEAAGSDEAYLNITEYCAKMEMSPQDAVSQLRREVVEQTGLTVSAGIAANAKLAKIVSNKNKPNGQFCLASERATIMTFMKNLPIRKVNGVGRVFERELQAVGIDTCGDIYEHRALLTKLFGEKAFQFLVQCYLGLGRTRIGPAEDSERKSVGTESTFSDISSKADLRAKLRYLSEELQKDLERTQFKGKTLVLKIKLHTYEVFTRQTILPKAIHMADDLYQYALPILRKLESDYPNMRLRLMGLRVTHLISMKKPTVDFFGAYAKLASTGNGTISNPKKLPKVDGDGWEVWPDEEFEEAARQERRADFEDIEALSQEHERRESDSISAESPSRASQNNVSGMHQEAKAESGSATGGLQWTCPICNKPQVANYREFNEHVDFCLSKQAIKEAVKNVPDLSERKVVELEPDETESQQIAKRGRPRSEVYEPNMKKKKVGLL